MEQMEQDGTKWNKQNQMEQVFQIIQENPKRNQTDANGIIWEQLGDEENNRQINVPAEEGKENQIQGSETRCAYKSGCQTTRREGRTMQYEKERAERKRNSGRENPDGEGGWCFGNRALTMGWIGTTCSPSTHTQYFYPHTLLSFEHLFSHPTFLRSDFSPLVFFVLTIKYTTSVEKVCHASSIGVVGWVVCFIF